MIRLILLTILLSGCASQEWKDFCKDLHNKGYTSCIQDAEQGYNQSRNREQFGKILEQIDIQEFDEL